MYPSTVVLALSLLSAPAYALQLEPLEGVQTPATPPPLMLSDRSVSHSSHKNIQGGNRPGAAKRGSGQAGGRGQAGQGNGPASTAASRAKANKRNAARGNRDNRGKQRGNKRSP